MIKTFLALSLLYTPLQAFAAQGVDTIGGLIGRFNALLNILVPFLIGLAVFIIIWGIFIYVTQAANEEKRREALNFVIWGVFGVFLMISVWGLVALLVRIFDFRSSYNPNEVPRIPPFQSEHTDSSRFL